MNYEKGYFLIGLCEWVSECYVGPQISNFELWFSTSNSISPLQISGFTRKNQNWACTKCKIRTQFCLLLLMLLRIWSPAVAPSPPQFVYVQDSLSSSSCLVPKHSLLYRFGRQWVRERHWNRALHLRYLIIPSIVLMFFHRRASPRCV